MNNKFGLQMNTLLQRSCRLNIIQERYLVSKQQDQVNLV